MWTIFKVFIEFATILLLFYVWGFCPWGMYDLNSPTRDQTYTPCIRRCTLNHWTTREIPSLLNSFNINKTLVQIPPLSCTSTYPITQRSCPLGCPILSTFEWVSEWVKLLSRVRLCDPMDCSPPGSSVHGILQARVLEWVAISFSRGYSQPRGWTQVSHIAGRRVNLFHLH